MFLTEYLYSLKLTHGPFAPPPPESRPIEIRQSNLTFDKLIRYGSPQKSIEIRLN